MTPQISHRLVGLLLLTAALSQSSGRLHAIDHGCAMCGQLEGCQKVCRLVCEEKKVTTTCWGVKHEDFCINGPSVYAGRNIESVCDDDTDPKSPCTQPKKFVWKSWIPAGNPRSYTRSKLMKRTITRTIPTFKYVVEELCPECQASYQIPDVPAGTDLPPLPQVAARLLK